MTPSCWILALLNSPLNIALVLARFETRDHPQSIKHPECPVALSVIAELGMGLRNSKHHALSCGIRSTNTANITISPGTNPIFSTTSYLSDKDHGSQAPLGHTSPEISLCTDMLYPKAALYGCH